MAEDLANLEISVQSGQVTTATSNLDKLTNSAKKTESATSKVEKSWSGATAGLGKLAAKLAVAATAYKVFKDIIGTTREFQVLQAGLKTATGSVENAQVAFGALQKIAIDTPYGLQQVTTAFTKLVNYGLTPSREAIMSYGDTASALGKSLEQMVEAVADAATGEFERLKEFGIKSSKEGDKVTFTFRGIKTEVANTSEAIEGYLIKLGQNNFAGAMEDRMKTLDGAFANLEDSWDQLLFSIGESGLGDIIASTIGVAITALDQLTAYFASGQFETGLEAWKIAFEGTFEAMESLLKDFRSTSQEEYDGFFDDSKGVWDDIIAYIQGIGPMFTAFVEEVAIRLWGIVDAIKDIGNAAYQQLKADLGAMIALGKAAGTAIVEALKGNFSGAWDGLVKDANTAMAENVKATEKLQKDSNERRIIREGVVASEIESIYAKAGERLERQEQARQEARAKRQKYDAEQAAGMEGDPLARFKVGGSSGSSPSASKGGGKKGGGSSGPSEFERLVEDLQREEDAIRNSYEKRLQLILDNTKAGSDAQTQLSLALTDKYEEEALRLADSKKRELETQWQGFAEEERILAESYEKRREIILSATETTEEQKLALLAEAQEKYQSQMRKHNSEQNKLYLDAASEFFGNLSAMGSTFGKKGFEIAKKAAIAQATIKMYESATSAYASLAGIPYVGPALGAAAAAAAVVAGAANIASIQSQTYQAPTAGNYAQGGIVPGTSYSGDRLQANVNSGEMILNKGQQRNLFNMANGEGGSKQTVVQVHNYGSEKVETRTTDKGDQQLIEFIIGRAKSAVVDDIKKGGTGVSRAIEGTYGLGRGKRAAG